MATRDLSRNLPAKKYSHKNPTELRLDFVFTGSGTRFIDIASALSAINRKFVSQQAYFYVSKVELLNNSDCFVDIHTAPDTWVVKNAYRRGRALYEKMNSHADLVSEGLSPKYYDFKVYMSSRHRSEGTSNPAMFDINGGFRLHEPQEWAYSEFISQDSDGDLTQEADNFMCHLLGPHTGSSDNWVSIGLVKSYADSRVTTQNEPNDSNIDVTDPLLNLFDSSSEDALNDIVANLMAFNDAPPYDLDEYVGANEVDMAFKGRLVTSTDVGRKAAITGFCAPFGLICVDPQNIGAEDNFRISVTLAPGPYHGVYAERV